MLDDIREKKTSLTTYILVGLAGVGMLFIGVPFLALDQSNDVAEVNGQSISYNQLQQEIGNIQRNNPEIDAQEVEREAMRQLISRLVLSEHAQSSGFYYPDEALYTTLKSQFDDETAYQSFLDRIGMNAVGYEQVVRDEMATQTYYGILAKAQQSHPVISDSLTANLGQHRSFSILRLPMASALQQSNVSDSDIEAYYKENQAALMRPPEVAIEYVLFDANDLSDPSKISDDALAQARQTALTKSSKRDGTYLIFDQKSDAEQAKQALDQGASYKEITAKIDDSTVSGEYGQFNLHSNGEGISPAADQALFSLKKTGDISPVIETDYGFMVVVAGRIQIDDQVSDEQLRLNLANENAQIRYHELTNDAFDAAQDDATIEQIAAMLGAKKQDTGLFNQTQLPQQWLATPEVISQLFGDSSVAIGQMGQPVALNDNQSVFFAISARKEAVLPELDEIRDQVALLAQTSQAEQLLNHTAEEIVTAWTEAQPPQSLVKSINAELVQYDDVSAAEPVADLSEATQRALLSQSTRVAILDGEHGDKLVARINAVSQAEPNEQLQKFIAAEWQRQAQLLGYHGIVNWLTSQADIKIKRTNVE